MTDSLTSDGYTQPHSYGDIPVLPTRVRVDGMTAMLRRVESVSGKTQRGGFNSPRPRLLTKAFALLA
jgi:hypothetical protein